MAQMCRFIHADSGLAWLAMTKCMGQSNDVLNALMIKYDTMYVEKRIKIAPFGSGAGRPMASYATRRNPITTKDSWGTYIASPIDMTALVLDVGKMPIKSNKNSILKSTDIIVVFKSTGSSSNVLTDVLSQIIPPAKLQDYVNNIGIITDPNIFVPGAFIKLLMSGFAAIEKAIESIKHRHMRTAVAHRIFITGHSLGGALATIFGLILAEGQKSLTLMNNVNSIHLVAFGCPRTMNRAGCQKFNSHLLSGFLTYDRAVSQATPSLIYNLSSILIKNDFIPGFPIGYKHPGFTPSKTDETNDVLDLYSLEDMRNLYGITVPTYFRNKSTWPFPEDPYLFSKQSELDNHVSKIQKGGSQSLVSNFISIPPLPYINYPHGETLGLIPKSSHREIGMKNPVDRWSNLTAYFSFCPKGVKIEYLTEENTLVSYKNPV